MTLAALSFAVLLFLAAPAFAATVTDRPLLFGFDGSDTTAGALVEPSSIAIDDSSGAVYVAENSPSAQEPSHHAISKFNPGGSAAIFSATGTSSLFGTPAGPFHESGVSVAVDNSGGAGQGRIYVVDNFGEGRLSAFAPDGTFLWEDSEVGSFPEDVAVDSAGHPWVLFGSSVKEFANSGSPPEEISSFAVSEGRELDIDAAGDVYVAGFSGVDKYVGGVFSSTVVSGASRDVAVDQSVPSGHVFVASGESFKEYDGSGTEIGAYGAASLNKATAIAYNPALNRVYVGDTGLGAIEAFGPAATGTTPDSTIEPSTVIGPGTAEFHGEVNPQSVPNGYYFEWSDFEKVFRSPLQTLPEDSVGHPVSYKATNLLGNVNWKVRLVGVNTASGLRSASTLDAFTPPNATAPPDVTIVTPSAVSSSSATINGTINPHEDSTRWQVLVKATSAACGTSYENFEQTGLQYLAGGEVSTPVDVEFELRNLLPAQHYCAFLEANNSFQLFGTGTQSGIEEFTTEAVPPSELETSFAAPRTDTTARINGLVNPEGEADFTYHFELSEDGVNWTVLPEGEATKDARRQVFVSEELTGLRPDTTYHYRLASSENGAGPASSSGDERTFTTRTSAEMILPQRGIELVNNPDKGNQNVLAQPPEMGDPSVSPDGNRTIWQVTGGAPGGYNGSFSAFLAERTPSGWQSRSILPPTAEQFGGGSYSFEYTTVTPDFSHFVFTAQERLLGEPQTQTYVRLDTHQHGEALRSYSVEFEHDYPGSPDRTDDDSHVLAVNNNTHQLEDIGGASPKVVSLMPNGGPSSCGLTAKATFVGSSSTGQAEGARGVTEEWRPGYHMIDRTDASLVYFEARPNGECSTSTPWGLYLRNRESEETKLIDSGTGGHDVAFVTASHDGRQGYFVTYSQLDPADENEDPDLYRYNVGSGEATCLTCVVPDANLRIGGNYSHVLVSADFSHFYFESENELVPGQPPAVSGASIYVLSGGEIRYVARGDKEALGSYETQISDDGNVLAWNSSVEQTADEVAAPSALYLYDDHTDSVECVSCAYGGVTEHRVAGPNEDSGFRLSPDGSTLAFVAGDDLVPLDVNRGQDIYEWRDSVRRLVTNGLTEFSGGFAGPGVRGIDADGSNIFFTVADPGLTGFEQDGLGNLYDARIGGGFEPPSQRVPCDGDSCQGPLVTAPVPGAASSATYSGRGNAHAVAHRRCGVGKLRRGRRCVSKRALTGRACRKKRDRARRRCVRSQTRQLTRIQRRQLRNLRRVK